MFEVNKRTFCCLLLIEKYEISDIIISDCPLSSSDIDASSSEADDILFYGYGLLTNYLTKPSQQRLNDIKILQDGSYQTPAQWNLPFIHHYSSNKKWKDALNYSNLFLNGSSRLSRILNISIKNKLCDINMSEIEFIESNKHLFTEDYLKNYILDAAYDLAIY